MSSKLKEVSTTLNGRAGSYYNMIMRTKYNTTEVNTNKLDIRINISQLNLPIVLEDNIDLKKDKSTLILKINNTIVDKTPIVLDFDYLPDVEGLNYTTDISNLEPLLLNIEATLLVESESNYITNTILKDSIQIPALYEDKLFVDLGYKESSEHIYCNITTNIDPDFLEIKDTHNNWQKISTKNPIVKKSGEPQFIQARGKKNGYYSFSNIIKIIN